MKHTMKAFGISDEGFCLLFRLINMIISLTLVCGIILKISTKPKNFRKHKSLENQMILYILIGKN